MKINIIILIKNFLKGKYSSIGRTVDCGSKGCRFESFFLPIMIIYKIFTKYNIFFFNLKNFNFNIINNFLINFFFLNKYYQLNELIWQEGFLFDFLQKKIIDNWLKKFIIYSANLFNERLVFDMIIKFYLNLIIWPLHKLFIFEFNNINWILYLNLFIFFLTFFFFIFFFFFFII